MRVILEIKHDNTVETIYYKGGMIRNSRYSSLSDVNTSEIWNKEIIVVIPDSFLVTKNLTISGDIKNMLALRSYLVRSLPVNINDLYNDYFVFGNRLYFIGVRKELLSDCMSLLKRAKVKVKTVIPKSFLFKIAYNLNYPKYLGFNFDENYTSIFSFEGNGYFFFVVLPYGSINFIDVGEEIQITKFINEIYRIVSSFQNQTKISIEEFFFFTNKEYSRLPVLSYLSKVLQRINFITMDDGKYWDPYSKILDLKGSFPINLSIDKILVESNKEVLMRQLDNSSTYLILGLIVFLVVSFIVGGNSVSRQRMILEAIKNNYHSQLNTLSSNDRQSSSTENNTFYGYRVLQTLNRVSNEGIYLENFYIKEKKFYLTVISSRYSEIGSIVDNFNSSGIEASMEGNAKFSIFEGYEFNRAQIKVEQR